MVFNSIKIFLGIVAFSLLGPLARAGDFFISSYEPMPKNNLVLKSSKLLCPKAFQAKDKEVYYRSVKIASYMHEKGQPRDNSRRGMKIEHSESVDREVSDLYKKIFRDWEESGAYSKEETTKSYTLENKLDPNRVRLFSIEEFNGKKFSAVRAYDTSRDLKYHGELVKLKPARDLIEESFGISQDHLYQIAGIKNHKRSWVLGLVDIRKTYKDAIQNLLSLVANSLDLHYNKREFFNFNETKAIEDQPIDVIFYGRKKLKNFYKRVFELSPLADSFGSPIELEKGGYTYLFYRYKGSDFIKKFLDLKYHEPSFNNTKALAEQNEKQQMWVRKYRSARLNIEEQKDARASSLEDFVSKASRYFLDFVLKSSEQEKLKAVVSLMELRNNVSREVFDVSDKEVSRRDIVEGLLPLLPFLKSDIPSPILAQIRLHKENLSEEQIMQIYYPLVHFIDTVTHDPATYILNSTTKVNP